MLQSIRLGSWALRGDGREDRTTINDEPYNYKNTLTIRSEIEWVDEWIDLPSLTEFKGDFWNFQYIGSVILESMDLVFDWCRYPSIIVWWNRLRWLLLLVHLFPQILKYAFSHFLIIRCCCSRIIHQTQKRLRLIPIPLFPFFLTNRLDVHEPLNTQSINRQLPHRFKQARFHSIHFQRDHRLREECEEWNPVTCESRSLETPPEASSI